MSMIWPWNFSWNLQDRIVLRHRLEEGPEEHTDFYYSSVEEVRNH